MLYTVTKAVAATGDDESSAASDYCRKPIECKRRPR